jgi:hypothetical protein
MGIRVGRSPGEDAFARALWDRVSSHYNVLSCHAPKHGSADEYAFHDCGTPDALLLVITSEVNDGAYRRDFDIRISPMFRGAWPAANSVMPFDSYLAGKLEAVLSFLDMHEIGVVQTVNVEIDSMRYHLERVGQWQRDRDHDRHAQAQPNGAVLRYLTNHVLSDSGGVVDEVLGFISSRLDQSAAPLLRAYRAGVRLGRDEAAARWTNGDAVDEMMNAQALVSAEMSRIIKGDS